MTKKQLENARKKYLIKQNIQALKDKLTATDYYTIKYLDGYLTAEEYEPVKAQRQQWREEINTLESELNN